MRQDAETKKLFMRDYLTLESSPTDEDCFQVSSTEDYVQSMKDECNRYCAMLTKRFKNIGLDFTVKRFYHDFGNYFQVVVYFNDESESDIDKVNYIESNLPQKWSDNEILNHNSTI